MANLAALESQPIVLVDMDGVIAGFDERQIELIQVRKPELEIVPKTGFYFEDDYPKEHRDKIKQYAYEPGFFLSLPVLAKSVEGLQNIQELGYHPRICSSPMRDHPTVRAEKLGWLEKHIAPAIGTFIVAEAEITTYKAGIGGIALIDDKDKIRDADKAPWTHIIFNQEYNQISDAPYRLTGWQDPNLGPILANCTA